MCCVCVRVCVCPGEGIVAFNATLNPFHLNKTCLNQTPWSGEQRLCTAPCSAPCISPAAAPSDQGFPLAKFNNRGFAVHLADGCHLVNIGSPLYHNVTRLHMQDIYMKGVHHRMRCTYLFLFFLSCTLYTDPPLLLMNCALRGP